MTMMDDRFTFVKVDETASEHIAAPKYSYWQSVFRKFFSSKLAILMLVIALVIIVTSYIQPNFSNFSPLDGTNVNNAAMKFLRPNAQYWFGTDNVGKSLFDAVWYGTRTSLTVALLTTVITNVIGIVVGMIWGYSKRFDAIMLEIYNIIYNIPFMLLVIVMLYILGPGMWQLIFAMSCTTWLGVAYFIRVQVMIIRDREYNLASRCLGTPMHRVLTHNILPYLISVIVTSIARDVPSYISYEVFLSFLGVGLTVEDGSLGSMIQRYSPYMTSAPYLFWIPVAFTALISVSLYIVGQTLADASDPRTHMM